MRTSARRAVAIDAVAEEEPPSNPDAPPTALSAPVSRINAWLSEQIGQENLPPALDEAVRYSLLGGGKRLRPLLAWHSAGAVGADGQSSLPAGGAIELIHAFSLVHDDLPAMDDDDLRRGRPTLHVHAGEAMAILAGDAMTSIAFQILLREAADASLGSMLAGELASATTQMIAGQVYDTLGGFDEKLGDSERVGLTHRLKTAALIRASCRMGAMCGLHEAGVGVDEIASRPELDAVTRYGGAVGLMFQIVDDLLDVEQSSRHLGKRAGKDIQAGKLTFPGVLGVDESRRRVRQLTDDALRAIGPLAQAGDPLRDLCRFLAARTR